ncbi:MAG: hypothetical protein WAP03_06810 [Methylorubrum rhodinum]|uniref:hypothetical protein n=1 Tax=Methylorubrum rhodinum TaxID=29428 RepID=UPI003BB01AE9
MTEIKTVADVLDGLLAIYATPGTWTRGGIAQDAAGQAVAADSPEAVAWSLEGALERVIGDWEAEPSKVAWSECLRRQELLCGTSKACGVDLSDFNDTAHHQGVVVAILHMGRAQFAPAA